MFFFSGANKLAQQYFLQGHDFLLLLLMWLFSSDTYKIIVFKALSCYKTVMQEENHHL